MLLVLLGVVAVGHATSLGGLSSTTLLATSPASAVGAPVVIGCDNFTGTTGASLAGRAATGAIPCAGRAWTVHVGTWTIQANRAASSATANAVATQNTTIANSSVQVVLSSLNTGGRSGGVVLSHDGASNYLAAVMIDGTPDRVELRLVAGAAVTVLKTINPTFATTNTLQLSRSAGVLTVVLNTISIGSYIMTAADLTSLGAGTRAGLFGGNASVGFDDFAATNP